MAAGGGDGDSDHEIRRAAGDTDDDAEPGVHGHGAHCLKRHLSDVVYRQFVADSNAAITG